ncbi:MAG: IS1595 family transposase [Dechloromonas sp.]|uniref:IS1595 family transposase n=1 Tax=Candidatus Dechloromonas phosphorivorans TaxID=2899244 RepID=A0A935MSL6_9RHOO|nr:IS1595 family transposase [Candidatus Dechloromonas phosphorivorans]
MSAHFWHKASSIPLTTLQIARLSEEEAWEWFVKMRWGDSGEQVCPRCESKKKHYFKKTRKQWCCKDCKYTFSVTTDTLLANRKMPFGDILLGMLVFANAHKGKPALEMRRDIGHTYRTNYVLAGKFREAMIATRDESMMSGDVEIDGAHFSGYIRKGRKIKAKKTDPEVPKKYAVKTTEEEYHQGEKMGRQHRTKYNRRAGQFMPNRRIVMVFRQRSPNKGEGAVRTLTAVIHRETSAEILALSRKWIAKGSTISTDECPSYGKLKQMDYTHLVVNHSVEFSTDEGVNENQAESFFGRMRRAEVGSYHRITPKYMDLYAAEIAWREDMRRKNTAEQLFDLGGRILRAGLSKDWRNHCRGPMRKDENLFWVGKDPRLSRPKSPYSKPTQSQ